MYIQSDYAMAGKTVTIMSDHAHPRCSARDRVCDQHEGEETVTGRFWLAAAPLAAAALLSFGAHADTTLRVMSFNVYGGGANDGKPVDETVAAIKAAGADIIGMQETRLESDPCDADNCP